ncbi:glycosyltransferase [Roseococcus suduntuyensis]|uniref:Hopene-associated glycosyltransferase HpnB n=1 Tax=Roseococcus suduntuyensis TaxID=455361 RepID=A0A840ADW4_9PROT|nr:glycosyltransferase [Roseococcus suduntuyensis]MBB3898404.1 hopene-associated glycosyltransferase HpnB [Roseococcus suduntuyensis]
MIWLAAAAAIAWLVLLLGRGFFWRADVTDEDADTLPDPAEWPEVAILIPARNEAETIGQVVAALRVQDYPGRFTITVVDDRSTDGTGEIARAAGANVVTGGTRPPGWSGKLNALRQGLEALAPGTHTHILLTDADIAHAPDSLRRLVQRAEAGSYALVSLMARLRCQSRAERWLIPAFVFFFMMLYPFAWSNDPRARTAAAAGGCVLLRRRDFEAVGGLAPIHDRIIDDCALAGLVKGPGRATWVGLTGRVVSLRAYPHMADIRAMVARTAYAQLLYNPVLLLGMVAALALVFLAPPLLALLAPGWAGWLGAFAWAAMVVAYAPMLRFYGLSAWRGFALPLVAAAYLLFTLDSARAEWQGRGGLWKGESLSRK